MCLFKNNVISITRMYMCVLPMKKKIVSHLTPLSRDHRCDAAALLSGTLKTYQRASCNEEWMTLKCPIGTAILVTVARYGRASIDSAGKCSITDPMIAENQLNSTCLWPSALQVFIPSCSLLELFVLKELLV